MGQIKIVSCCSECDRALDPEQDYCPDHPDAEIHSVVARLAGRLQTLTIALRQAVARRDELEIEIGQVRTSEQTLGSRLADALQRLEGLDAAISAERAAHPQHPKPGEEYPMSKTDIYLRNAEQVTSILVDTTYLNLRAYADSGPTAGRGEDLVIGHADAVLATARALGLQQQPNAKRIEDLVEWLRFSAPARTS